jgi:hypothetical protein
MATVASSARSVNDVHYALLRHPLRSNRPHDVTCRCNSIGRWYVTYDVTFFLLAPYPTERLDVILHQNELFCFISLYLPAQLHGVTIHKLTTRNSTIEYTWGNKRKMALVRNVSRSTYYNIYTRFLSVPSPNVTYPEHRTCSGTFLWVSLNTACNVVLSLLTI